MNPDLFQTDEERALWDLVSDLAPEFEKKLSREGYGGATKLYAETLYDKIHEFFDRVLVKVDDEAIRRNRHALMRDIFNLYQQRVADLSAVTQVEPPQAMLSPRRGRRPNSCMTSPPTVS